MFNDIIKENLIKRENLLSIYATKSSEGVRLNISEEDIRGSFAHDADRIIHSLSFTRYLDKTQVFSLSENDNISKRMTHVSQVSKIGRTIGRALNLNEDLIEAAALGHDLGHVPFGHAGEKILNKISLENNEGNFNHNVQSVRILMTLEHRNLCIQTLDAILCHNGELELKEYHPVKKNINIFLNSIENTYKDQEFVKTLVPMTLEGCVVRISDIIAYLGRDIEDAIRLGVIKKQDLPKDITDILGNSNREIINVLIMDVINNSFNKPYLKMSDKVFNAMQKLKEFNYKNIYSKANKEEDIIKYEKMFRALFNKNLEYVNTNKKDENIYKIYLNYKDQEYLKSSSARIVIDYIAGMTDRFFISEYEKIEGSSYDL